MFLHGQAYLGIGTALKSLSHVSKVPSHIAVASAGKFFLRNAAAAVLGFSILAAGPAMAQQQQVVIDNAKLLPQSRREAVERQLVDLENRTQWRIRVFTTVQPIESLKQIRQQLLDIDDRTILVVETLTSPNVLSFSTGSMVSQQLPRQFFVELQSRFGNQFFVRSEGETQALLSSLEALSECLAKEGGCRNVPGLTDDLYYLTLATSIAGGCVFGYAARVPPYGRVATPWQWILLFSPLWFILFGSFGILPVVGRTSEIQPLIKNTFAFLAGAAIIYLTPSLGPPPGKS